MSGTAERQRIRRIAGMACALIVTLGVVACATQVRYSSSVVDYLYPDTSDVVEEPTIPVMELPITVGIAFVPDTQNRRQHTLWQQLATNAPSESNNLVLVESQKIALMKEVADHFGSLEFIGSIEIIPSAYLTPQGSFTNLDQIRTMYGIDAIVLLAYDQVQFTDEGASSFLYWTIVGAYVVPGEKNSTQTMMDAVVFDIGSRKMLFRAPGTSQVAGKATPVNLSAELRADSERGFQEAAENLVENLDVQLELFKEKVRQQPERYQVTQRPGYTGAGSLGGVFLACVALIGGSAWWRRRRT